MTARKLEILTHAPRSLAAAAIICSAMFAISPARALEPMMCTMDARQCPDGSYVSRTGPNCEFSPCPGENEGPGAKPPSNSPPRMGDIVKDNIRQKKTQPPAQQPPVGIENPDAE